MLRGVKAGITGSNLGTVIRSERGQTSFSCERDRDYDLLALLIIFQLHTLMWRNIRNLICLMT